MYEKKLNISIFEKSKIKLLDSNRLLRASEFPNIPFTREVLRILDSLDYDLVTNHVKDNKQDITHWINN